MSVFGPETCFLFHLFLCMLSIINRSFRMTILYKKGTYIRINDATLRVYIKFKIVFVKKNININHLLYSLTDCGLHFSIHELVFMLADFD